MKTVEQMSQDVAYAVVSELRKRRETVSFAESCTGGMLASEIVGISGASEILQESFVTYSDEAKHELLQVSWETLNAYSAVSETCAREMVLGLRARTGADHVVAVTGYAEGAISSDGMVYLAYANKEFCFVSLHRFFGNRNDVRKQATYAALLILADQLGLTV